MRSEELRSPPALHSWVVTGAAAGVLALGVLVWPAILETLLSLDWYIGDLTGPARIVSLCLLALAALLFLVRRSLARRLARDLPTGKSFLLAGVSIVIASVFCIAAAEVACHALQIPFRESWEPTENAFGQFDPVTGWSYIPDHSAQQAYGDDERVIDLHFSEVGSRIPSPERELRYDAPTLIFVGGSVGMGHGVTHEESFPGVLEAMPGFPLQVVNLSVQGFGTDQAYLQLDRYIDAFETAIVVYVFICDHIRRNSVADRRYLYTRARFMGTKPKFSLRGDGTVVQTHEPQRYEDFEYSRLLAFLRVNLTRYGPIPRAPLTRGLVRAMRERAESAGARFLVVQWPITGDRNVEMCGCCPFEGIESPLLVLDDRVPAEFDSWRLEGDPHPNPRAHVEVARLILEDLLGRGWVEMEAPATRERTDQGASGAQR